MTVNKSKKLPHFKSVSQLVDFFDRTDLGDYFDHLPEVDFDVDLKRKVHLFELDPKLADKLDRLAKSRKTSSQKLLNAWVREKFQKRSS